MAQTGILRGSVRDQVTNQPILGATVLVEFSTQGVTTDINGNFMLRKVPAGNQTIVVSFVGYKTRKTELRIAAGKVTILNVLLKENIERLKEVAIDAKRLKDTDISVVSDIKKEDQVASGMSGDQIIRSQDVDAAQIIRRMGSVQLIDERFVNIRGMNERYNAVMINDVLTPSMEPDSKAFSFDVIPTSVLDRVMIYKTGSADMPAEFAGGMVKLYTKDVPDENRFYFSAATGLRNESTFHPGLAYTGGTTDALGYDDGTRKLPDWFPKHVPNENHRDTNTSRQYFLLPNNWRPDTGKLVLPDLRATLGLSHNFHAGKALIGTITSLNYSNISQYSAPIRLRYQPSGPGYRYQYKDYQTTNDVRVGLIHNWTAVINRRNTIEWHNLFNQLARNETVLRNGREYAEGDTGKNQAATFMHSLAYRYETRSILSSQLGGTHYLGDNWMVKWTGGYGSTHRTEPDYRRIRYANGKLDLNPAQDTLNPNMNTASHFFSDMKEKVYTGALDFEHSLTPFKEEENQTKLKFGGYLENKTRDFDARWFYYVASPLHSQRPGHQGFSLPNLFTLTEIDKLFVPSNMLDTIGLVLREGTRPSDKYSAYSHMRAAYASLYAPIGTGKWIVSAGARLEANDQSVNSRASFDSSSKDIVARINKADIFPSANITYKFSDSKFIRLAYFESVNRPAFREMASFSYFDYFNNINIVGNPNLQNCYIHNFDFRYDLYPSRRDVITFGAFGKYFINPIERVVNTDSIQYTYKNATSAYSAGLEFEMRKDLSDVTDNLFLKYVTLVANASYIVSRVTLGSANVSGLDYSNRALNGQAPWMFNGGLVYSDEKGHTTFNLMYNVFGPRVYSVGNPRYPTQYEMPRHVVDLNVNKYISSHFELRISLQDILNAPYQIYQDSNNDGKIDPTKDALVSRYRRGQWFNLALTYKIY